MNRPRIALLVTDVDNTLFDWVSSWAACVPPLIQAMSGVLAVAPTEVERRIRAVHQDWGVTECPACAGSIVDDAAIREAIVTEYEERFVASAPVFPGVPGTLARVRELGTRVVAYTESRHDDAWRRLSLLGLSTLVDSVRADRRKPDPSTLREIAAEGGIEGHRVLYVGDNLWKDVAMARRGGVHGAWARYGTHRTAEADALLNRLCHWTRGVAAEERTAASRVSAPFVLERGLAELFDHFTFVPHG